MNVRASLIPGHLIVCATFFCSGTDQRKCQSAASLAFVIGIHRWIPLTKDQKRGSYFHLMKSSRGDDDDDDDYFDDDDDDIDDDDKHKMNSTIIRYWYDKNKK